MCMHGSRNTGVSPAAVFWVVSCARAEARGEMQRYASATFSAAFDASRDAACTGAYLEMLDTMRAEVASGNFATDAARSDALCKYGAALLPLCHAIGDLRTPGRVASAPPTVRAQLVFAGYDVDCIGGDAVGKRVGVSTWALTPFASARVVDEALLAFAAALQCGILAALVHWYALEEQIGTVQVVVHPRDAAALEEAGFVGGGEASGRDTASAVVGNANTTSGAADIDARVADLAAIAQNTEGIVRVLLHLLMCDTVTDTPPPAAGGAAATTAASVRASKGVDDDGDADDGGDDDDGEKHADPDDVRPSPAPPSRQLLKATVLTLALYAHEVVPAARALCVLRRSCARVWVGEATHACSSGARGHDVADALRATRAHWLAAAFGCIQLHAQASRPDAPAPLRTLYTSLALWADSCRRVHFRAAAVHFAAHCHWPAAVWARACALAANPDPGASAGAAVAPVLNDAAAARLSDPAAGVGTDWLDVAARCPGSGGAGGPQAALPWFPDGVVSDEEGSGGGDGDGGAASAMDDTLIAYALRRRIYLQNEGGLAPDPLYPVPTTILNVHLPDVYYAVCREPVVETQPVTRLMREARAESAALTAATLRAVELVIA